MPPTCIFCRRDPCACDGAADGDDVSLGADLLSGPRARALARQHLAELGSDATPEQRELLEALIRGD